jgi:uncharacterized protein
MSDLSNKELVEDVYERMLAEDLPGFLRMCADDAEVVYPDVEQIPWCGTWRGHEEITRWSDLHDEVDPLVDLQVDDLVADGDRVVALGTAKVRTESTGTEWESRYTHTWSIEDGRIRRFEAHFNTAAALEAHGLIAANGADGEGRPIARGNR